MEIKVNVNKENIQYIMKLAMGGCKELLNYPELCSLIDESDGEGNLFEYERDYDNWSRYQHWEKGCTPVHALAYSFCPEILNFPQYLKIPNKSGNTPLHFLTSKLLPKDIKIMDKILKIEGLDKLTDSIGTTPLHNIAKIGYIPILDYPGIEKIESPEFNTHGTPMTHLYYYAKDGLDKLLKHPYILTEYKDHGTPLMSLSYNKKIKPTVSVLNKYGFKMTKKWHPTKKLDRTIVNDIMSVSQSIRFLIYP